MKGMSLAAHADRDFEADDHRLVGEIFQAFRDRRKRRRLSNRLKGAGVKPGIRRIQHFRQSKFTGSIESKPDSDFLYAGDIVRVLPHRLHPALDLIKIVVEIGVRSALESGGATRTT